MVYGLLPIFVFILSHFDTDAVDVDVIAVGVVAVPIAAGAIKLAHFGNSHLQEICFVLFQSCMCVCVWHGLSTTRLDCNNVGITTDKNNLQLPLKSRNSKAEEASWQVG